MKLKLICHECVRLWNDDSSVTDDQIEQALVVRSLQNSAVYETICPAGHITKTIVQNSKHDLLFESGILALKDGYYREAVSSFAVALERFYEYCIRVLLSPLEKEIGRDNFIKTWKAVSKQSERQIGAFYMLYLSVFKKPPVLFDAAYLKQYSIHLGTNGNDPIEFRNMVIHKGYIPSYDQVLAFGEAVNFYMRSFYREFVETDGFDQQADVWETMDATRDIFKTTAGMSVTHLNTFMAFGVEEYVINGRSLIEFLRLNK